MKPTLLSLRLLAGFSCLLPLAHPVAAQTADRRTSLGLVVSGLQYKGDFGSDYWKQDASSLPWG
jgi:OOP family OmpA-OmpF porin